MGRREIAIAVWGLVVVSAQGLSTASADEGMWLFNDLPREVLKERHGFEPSERWADNLLLGAYQRYSLKNRGEIRRDIQRIYEMFPVLGERREQPAGNLSGGEQQMLAIGRALMARPRLLLLDEPGMGLAPALSRMIFRHVAGLRDDFGLTVLLVEQNAKSALKIADRGYVMETGRIILQGSSEELLLNRDVQRAYLGRDVDAQ